MQVVINSCLLFVLDLESTESTWENTKSTMATSPESPTTSWKLKESVKFMRFNVNNGDTLGTTQSQTQGPRFVRSLGRKDALTKKQQIKVCICMSRM